ncbi:MAG: 30S ribosomal protein S6e [Candidatus Rokuibacteriota bacterium]
MAEFKVNVGDPETKKTYPVTVTGAHANVLVRKKIGDEVDGMFLGLPGYKVSITGGSDKDGFAMRPELPGAARKRILVTESVGFHPAERGVRRKKAFRGSEIGPNILQINVRVTARGPKPIEELVKKEEKKA